MPTRSTAGSAFAVLAVIVGEALLILAGTLPVWGSRLEAPQNALAVLTAMITPAVLISACGALIFSTSTRLGRVIDRVRTLSQILNYKGV